MLTSVLFMKLCIKDAYLVPVGIIFLKYNIVEEVNAMLSAPHLFLCIDKIIKCNVNKYYARCTKSKPPQVKSCCQETICIAFKIQQGHKEVYSTLDG